MELLSVSPLLGKLLALLANIRLGRNGLTVTNTLAYYKHSSIAAVKSFITLDRGLGLKH